MTKLTGRRLRGVPLKWFLILPFFLQMVVAVGVTGWLSFRNGKLAVNKISEQLRGETLARIQQHLDTQLTMSHLVNQINLEIVNFNLLNSQDLVGLGSHFWRQLQIFKSLGVIYFGNEMGEFIAVQRARDGSFFFVKRAKPPAKAKVYSATLTGKIDKFEKNISEFIDIRQRPWYLAAKKKRNFTWGDIFPLQVSAQMDLPASVPLIDEKGDLRGVLGNNLSLEAVSEFLQSLKIGKSGQTFILERDGLLVASSDSMQPFSIAKDGKAKRTIAIESANPLLRSTTKYLLEKFGDFKQINSIEQLDFFIERERHFLEVLPYRDKWGIDWLIVVVVPEADFMSQIDINTRNTILLCLVALSLATLSGIITARWISEQLSRLNRAAKEIARSNWQQVALEERIREVGELGNSFNQMAAQLQSSFTQMQSLNRELFESESRLTQFLEALPVGVSVHDLNGRLTYVNRVGQNLLEIDAFPSAKTDELSRTFRLYQVHTQELYPEKKLPVVRALSGETVQIDDMEIHFENRKTSLEVLATPIFDRQGEVVYAITAFQDISKRKQTQEQLVHNALHDSLTDLPNRTSLMKRLEAIIARAKKERESLFAVLFLDLDGFKVINDSLGHLAGDRLLISIAHKLQSLIRSTDLAARLGGDEFVIVLERVEGVEEAVRVAQRIIAELQFPMFLEGREVVPSTSIGIVLGNQDYVRSEDLLRDADIAMYRAKASGRSRYEIFNAQMYAQALKRLLLENDLRKALERQEFVVYYQPIVSLKDGHLVGFEALVRWQHPTRGLVSPAEFIPIAEETGSIVALDFWVLETACEQVAAWKKLFPEYKSLKLSVNLSVRDLKESNPIEKITQILERTGLEFSSLSLEITESLLIENFALTIEALQQLRQRGIQISLDDFGCGYSSLSYLYRLPINNLKIDRSFISQAQPKSKNYQIAETIVALSDRLGLKAIAEGIETREQLLWLQGLECEFGQGYLISKPLNSDAMTVLLANRKSLLD